MARDHALDVVREGAVRAAAALFFAFSLIGAAPTAEARQVYPLIGGSGDAAATYECPKGEYVSGFSGAVGAWVDRISVVCASTKQNEGGATSGTFGGPGGSTAEITCPQNSFVQSVGLVMTKDARQVFEVVGECKNANGAATGEITFGGNDPGRTAGSSQNQPCRGGEAVVGFQLHYGKHVNAFGAICDAFYVPPPPPPAPTGVIVHTGEVAGAKRAPEDPRWGDWIGVWDAHTSQGVAFKVTFERDGDKLIGKFEDAPQPQYSGLFTQAGTSLGMIYQFTYVQPTTKGAGKGGFVINKDGKDFNGEITTNDTPPVKVMWRGHKISEPDDHPK